MLYVSDQENQTPFHIIVDTQYEDSIIKFYLDIYIHRRLYMHYHCIKTKLFNIPGRLFITLEIKDKTPHISKP